MTGRGRPPTSADPLVSIVTVALNSRAHIEEAISSVVTQSYGNIEYVVIDGGSTDGTLDVIRKCEDRIDRWISEPDGGIYDAMNKGIALCEGELIGVLNSDDQYLPGAIETAVRRYMEIPDRRAVVAGRWEILFGDRPLGIVASPSFRLPNVRFCHQAMFIPRRVYETVGVYDMRHRHAADLDLTIRMLKQGIDFALVDDVLVRYRAFGHSWRNLKAHARDQSEIVRRHLPLAPYLLFEAAQLRSQALVVLYRAVRKALGERRAASLAKLYFAVKERSRTGT